MKIAFFTEGQYQGKVPRNHPNMRTELAWMCALNATHHPLGLTLGNAEYDLGIVILPKNGIDRMMQLDRITYWKQHCKKLAIMQEGPNWYWQDYPLEQQIWYFNSLIEADFLLCHNVSDQSYYQGLTNKSTYVMPSLMIEDNIPKQLVRREKGVMIGGNMTSWYGGFDSMIIAQEFGEKIYAPSMGRKIEREEELDITHLPYMDWQQWMYELGKVKYGVHLMRTHAAGTFALNCAYLGIPCIGYKGLDTQELCHPECTVEIGDLLGAKQIAYKLRNDEKFYLYCSKLAKEKYKEHFHENIYNTTIKEQLKIS